MQRDVANSSRDRRIAGAYSADAPEPEHVYNQGLSSLAPATAANMAASSTPSSYLCDTLPPARLVSASPVPRARSPTPPMPAFEAPIVDNSALQLLTKTASLPIEARKSTADYIQPPARKLCVRHQRMADEGTNLKLQQVSLLRLCQGAAVGNRGRSDMVWELGGGLEVVTVQVRGSYSSSLPVDSTRCPHRLGNLTLCPVSHLHTNYSPLGTRCTPCRGTRGRQRRLVQLFLVPPPAPGPHPPRPTHHVLLLPALPPL